MVPTKEQSKQFKQRADGKKVVTLAMQGGGAHGAFTWGVVDKLLEDGRFIIEGMAGTSAGGMNAVATALGLIDGGNDGARKMLYTFWKKMSESGATSPICCGPIDMMLGKYTMYNSPGFLLFDFMSKILSPYQTNPMNLNSLRDLVEELFDFEKIQKSKDYKVFLAATHVYTGKVKIFPNEEITSNALQATACLPTMFKAVMVNNEYYWDGGFIANPPIYPLIYNCETPDVIVIKLNPTHRNRLPIASTEISDRLNEITNNESIVREMRSIHFISKLIEKGDLDKNKYKHLHLHLIENEESFQDLGWSSKLNTEWAFLEHLFEEGRKTCSKWIEKNFDKVGKETSFDMVEEFV